MRRLLPVVPLLVASSAWGQTLIQYDTVAADADAFVTCGFCATEKYGTIFYELPNGGGLPAALFPLQLQTVQIGLAGTNTTGDIFSGYVCSPDSTGGQIPVNIEIYAGTTVPQTITSLPGTGAWPGEFEVLGVTAAPLTRSVETSPGSGQFSLQINSFPVNLTVPSPAPYLRVVVNVPSGLSSAACTDLALQSPAISPFRDDNGVVGPRRNFIYQLGLLGGANQWTWNEDVADPLNMTMGINGDWLIRLEVASSTPIPDAGVDAGPVDMGPADMGPADMGPADLGPVDLGPVDMGPVDMGPVDMGPMADMGPPVDLGPMPTDAGPGDTGAPDVGPQDLGAGAPPPTITAITPNSIEQVTATTVTVVGTGFDADVELRIGQLLADVQSVSGSTTLTANIPMSVVAGVYDVVVTNPDGQSAVLPAGFTITGDGLDGDGGCVCTRRPGASPWARANRSARSRMRTGSPISRTNTSAGASASASSGTNPIVALCATRLAASGIVMKYRVMRGSVTLIGRLSASWAAQIGSTLHAEPSTLPKRTMQNVVSLFWLRWRM